jgi:glycosyltransferase involved in cell wall biosynthesis
MRAEELPFVSVVVPVLNGERTLPGLLSALLGDDYPRARREILVVDNASTDATPDILRDAPVTYLHEQRRGAARARNRGIVASRGEIVAFTDVDCVPATGWLRALVAGFREETVGGVAGEILPFPPRTAPERYAARIRHLSPERYLRRPIFPFAVIANLAFRREVFDTVGLLDPESPRGGESTDFCTRFLRETGLRLVLAREAVVLHRHRDTGTAFLRQQWDYGRGHAYLYMKYRQELPWGWAQTRQVYADLARTVGTLALASAGYVGGRRTRADLEFSWFESMRKLALRLGFMRQALSQGRLYL